MIPPPGQTFWPCSPNSRMWSNLISPQFYFWPWTVNPCLSSCGRVLLSANSSRLSQQGEGCCAMSSSRGQSCWLTQRKEALFLDRLLTGRCQTGNAIGKCLCQEKCGLASSVDQKKITVIKKFKAGKWSCRLSSPQVRVHAVHSRLYREGRTAEFRGLQVKSWSGPEALC